MFRKLYIGWLSLRGKAVDIWSKNAYPADVLSNIHDNAFGQPKVEHRIFECSIHDDVEILGHTFHGLTDIMQHVEMSLCREYSHDGVRRMAAGKRCEVHVGELCDPYPCFDSSDYGSENRSYSNFIFRNHPILLNDMRRLSELPGQINNCRVTEDVPQDMRPMVYYSGEGSVMLVTL